MLPDKCKSLNLCVAEPRSYALSVSGKILPLILLLFKSKSPPNCGDVSSTTLETAVEEIVKDLEPVVDTPANVIPVPALIDIVSTSDAIISVEDVAAVLQIFYMF